MGSKKTLLALLVLAVIVSSGSIYFVSAIDTLSAFDAADANTYTSITATAELGPSAVPGLLDLMAVGNFSQRWSALMSLHWIAYKNEDERENIFAELEDYLEYDDETIRFKVAEILAFYGNKDGLPVLIEFLENETLMPLSEPPATFAGRAQYLLSYLTSQSFETEAEGESWWNANENTLTFNEDTGKFE